MLVHAIVIVGTMYLLQKFEEENRSWLIKYFEPNTKNIFWRSSFFRNGVNFFGSGFRNCDCQKI
jgi:hypothetical protein